MARLAGGRLGSRTQDARLQVKRLDHNTVLHIRMNKNITIQLLPLDEAVASRAVFVIISGSDGQVDGNAFAAS